MRIQLDTLTKTVKVEQTVNFKELFDLLEKILPNREWEKFSIESNVVINNWSSPIVIEKYIQPNIPRYDGPYWYNNSGTYLCSIQTNSQNNSSASSSSNYVAGIDGLYNLEA